jgi:cytochrome P450
MALLFAGYDTMSITLTCALYQISQHPEVAEFILTEINAADSLDNPNQHQCVQGVLYETLTLSLPGTVVTRFVQKPLQLEGGFVVPINRNVIVPIWLIQRDAEDFPQPLDFRPDRWVQRQNDIKTKRKDRQQQQWSNVTNRIRVDPLPPPIEGPSWPFRLGLGIVRGKSLLFKSWGWY